MSDQEPLTPGQRVRAPRYVGGELHDARYVGPAPPLQSTGNVGGVVSAPIAQVYVRFDDATVVAVARDAVTAS